jgi:hypothetical protein
MEKTPCPQTVALVTIPTNPPLRSKYIFIPIPLYSVEQTEILVISHSLSYYSNSIPSVLECFLFRASCAVDRPCGLDSHISELCVTLCRCREDSIPYFISLLPAVSVELLLLSRRDPRIDMYPTVIHDCIDIIIHIGRLRILTHCRIVVCSTGILHGPRCLGVNVIFKQAGTYKPCFE